MEGQERIPVPPQQPPSPEGRDCEWCDQTAHHAIQFVNSKGMGVQRYMFTCDDHRGLAEANKRIRSSGR